MITASATLYALGAIATAAWLLILIRSMPEGEVSQIGRFASVGFGVIACAMIWPVFWGFILYGIWLGYQHDKGWRE